jgi:hypothetical protein
MRQGSLSQLSEWAKACTFAPNVGLGLTTMWVRKAQAKVELLLRDVMYDVQSLFRSLQDCFPLQRLDVISALFTDFYGSDIGQLEGSDHIHLSDIPRVHLRRAFGHYKGNDIH